MKYEEENLSPIEPVTEEKTDKKSEKKKNKKQDKNVTEKKEKEAIKTPLTVSKELKKIGESYSKYAMFLWYICIMSISVVLGILFKLPVSMIVVCCIFYVAMTPKLLYNYKKQKYEKRRFSDVNAYMEQMNNSFISTHNVLVSLRQTEATFVEGKMKTALKKAIEKIEDATSNVRQTEAEALALIEKEYSCEKVRNLHDYLIRGEARGGDCTDEFKIVDKMNKIWKKAVQDYHGTLVYGRTIIAVYFILLISICIYMLRDFPETIPLIEHSLVHVANMIQIISFVCVYTFADSKLNSSLLRDAKFMSEEDATSTYEYVKNFDGKKERKQYIPLIILSFFICLALFILKPSGITGIVCVGFVVLVFNMHKLTYYLNWLIIQGECKKAFPKWLFDVLLLMQTDSVEAAIFKSREYAPPILKYELERICKELDKTPGNPDVYMSFLAEFQIEGVDNAMRNLYSMAVGTGNREVMTSVIDSNMSMLQESEKKSIKNKGDLKTIYQYIPIVIVTLAMIAYMVAIILLVFDKLFSIMNTL